MAASGAAAMREGERCDVNECETVSPFQENDCFEKKKKRRTIYPVQGGVCFHPDSTVKQKSPLLTQASKSQLTRLSSKVGVKKVE